MLRLVGLIMILFFCGYAGISFYRYTVYCVDYVNGLTDGLKCLRKELEFSETILTEALITASEYGGRAKQLFLNCGNHLTEWESYIENENTSNKIKNICKYFYGQIGKSDLSNELKLIDVTIEKLNILQNEQKVFSEKTGKLWAKSGVLIGVVLLVLLF